MWVGMVGRREEVRWNADEGMKRAGRHQKTSKRTPAGGAASIEAGGGAVCEVEAAGAAAVDSHLCGAGAAAGVGRSRVDTPTLLLGAWAWAVAAAYRVAVGLARCRSCRTSMASCCGCA